jgi:hypothetical protein
MLTTKYIFYNYLKFHNKYISHKKKSLWAYLFYIFLFAPFLYYLLILHILRTLTKDQYIQCGKICFWPELGSSNTNMNLPFTIPMI